MRRSTRITRSLCAALLAALFLLTACAQNAPSPDTSAAKKETSKERSASGEKASPEADTVTKENTTAAGSPAGAATASGTAEASENGSESAEVTEPAVRTAELTLASLNIKYGAEGLDKVADAIREISSDIIGLQEVDVNCARSGYTDEPAELARLAGYPYYAFAHAISLGSGEYGTAILSHYPIESFEVIPLYSGNSENRSLGHAVINAEGIQLDVFVTHLSFEDRSLRIRQMETIAALLKDCGRYILLGDLNSFNLDDIRYLEAEYCVNRPERRYATFRRFDVSPDNIVVSKGFTELSSGASDAECSDHRLLYASFSLTGE